MWGAGTSAYQVEGNNKNSDWWGWENRVGLKEVSGQACRHYELFRQDFDLAKELNHNAHRFSIEWSRVEPECGHFNVNEIAHYVEVVDALRERGIEPIVTLHHFTNPAWFTDIGGWQNKNADKYFSSYVEKIVDALCNKVRYWVTINEPITYTHYAYTLGIWPPQERSLLKTQAAKDKLTLAHINAYRLIHDRYKQKNLLPPMVSVAAHIRMFQPYDNTLKNRCAAYLRDYLCNFDFLNNLARARSLDYIGINYYTRDMVRVKGWGLRHFLTDVSQESADKAEKNSLGWDVYPEGLFNLLLRLKRYDLPIFILENGICTQDDNQRWKFIYAHLDNIQLAMERGVKIAGYLYWSLLDNYEWHDGFGPHFGLIGVDYATHARTVRESAKKFASICKTGILP